jgi:hypothetical protein
MQPMFGFMMMIAHNLTAESIVGAVAGFLLALLIHKEPGVGYAAAIAALSSIVLIVVQGGVDQLVLDFNNLVERLDLNEKLGGGLALGAAAYIWTAIVWTLGYFAGGGGPGSRTTS